MLAAWSSVRLRRKTEDANNKVSEQCEKDAAGKGVKLTII